MKNDRSRQEFITCIFFFVGAYVFSIKFEQSDSVKLKLSTYSIDFYSQYEHDDRAREARTSPYSSWSRFYIYVCKRTYVSGTYAHVSDRNSSTKKGKNFQPFSGIIFRPI